MKILITGAGGQLGLALIRKLSATHTLTALNREALDIANREACAQSVASAAPEVVLNCAAYTAVDRAESEREQAFAINAHGPRYLAEACAKHGATFIHFSTDYVFNGSAPLHNDAPRAYVETDTTAPLCVYGESKREGELATLEANARAMIFRLSWVYSNDGANFYKTMLRLAHERDTLRVVSDQIGVPNFTGDIADSIAALLKKGRQSLSEKAGLYHLSARGEPVSWHQFATEIVRGAQFSKPPIVEPIPTSAYPTPAKRPAWSALDGSRFAATFGLAMPDWRDGLKRCLGERAMSA